MFWFTYHLTAMNCYGKTAMNFSLIQYRQANNNLFYQSYFE